MQEFKLTEITLNMEAGLYCLSYAPLLKSGKTGTRGAFMTCHGFAVVQREIEEISKWLWEVGQSEAVQALAPLSNAENPSADYYRYYKALCEAGAAHNKATGARCGSSLTAQFIGLEGKVVTVEDQEGEIRTFRVGRSTGWKPIHLEADGMSAERVYKSVRVKGGK